MQLERTEILNKLATTMLQKYSAEVITDKMLTLSCKHTSQPFPEIFEQLLANNKKVLLLLGETGSGKSVCCIHFLNRLWQRWLATQQGPIPVYIYLPHEKNSAELVIQNVLLNYGITPQQFDLLRTQQDFVFIIDGYESTNLKENIYLKFGLAKWRAKLIVTCNSLYFFNNANPAIYFAPVGQQKANLQLVELHELAPLSQSQINDALNDHLNSAHYLPKDKQTLLSFVSEHPPLLQLLSRPLLLNFFVKLLSSLPANLSAQLSLDKIINQLFEQWFNFQATKLTNLGWKITPVDLQAVVVSLVTTMQGKQLTEIIYRPSSRLFAHDSNPWESFFNYSVDVPPFYLAYPLKKSGPFTYAMCADTLIEFFTTYRQTTSEKTVKVQQIKALTSASPGAETNCLQPLLANYPLNKRLLVNALNMIGLFVDRIKYQKSYKDQLLQLILLSRQFSELKIAAANAITILNYSRFAFTEMDLSNVTVEGADLTGVIFDNVRLSGANLKNVKLYDSYINETDFSEADMENVNFGELPYFNYKIPIHGIAYNQTGSLLAIAVGNKVRVWNIEKRQLKNSFCCVGSIANIYFHPQADLLAVAISTGYISLFDVANDCATKTFALYNPLAAEEKTPFIYPQQRVIDVAYSHDGSHLAISFNHSFIMLMDAASLKALKYFSANEASIINIKFHPNKPILIISEYTRLYLVNLLQEDLSLTKIAELPVETSAIAFSNDGLLLAAAGVERTISLINFSSYKVIKTKKFAAQVSNFRCIDFSNDDQQLAIGLNNNAIWLWDIADDQWSHMHNQSAAVSHLLYQPNKPIITVANSEGMVLFLPTNRIQDNLRWPKHTEWVMKVIHDDNNQQLISASFDQKINLWKSSTGDLTQTLKGHEGIVRALARHPQQPILASAGDDRVIRIWDLNTYQQLRVLEGHENEIGCLSFTPDGRYLLSASDDYSIKKWDINRNESLLTFKKHTRFVTCLTHHPYLAQFASGSDDASIIIWSMDELKFNLKNNHTGVTCLIYTPDGSQLISAGYDKTINVRNTSDYQLHYSLEAPNDGLLCLSCSPDGKLLFTGGQDNYLRIWNLETRECIFFLEAHKSNILSLCLSPKGWLFTAGSDNAVKAWAFVEKETGIKLYLKWTTHAFLTITNSPSYQKAKNLSPSNRNLFFQRSTEQEFNNKQIDLASNISYEDDGTASHIVEEVDRSRLKPKPSL